jgi:hypothetical protein
MYKVANQATVSEAIEQEKIVVQNRVRQEKSIQEDVRETDRF